LALRVNESGDFHSQLCVEKLEKIAKILSAIGIKTYCYTSRKDLNFKYCRNLIVNGSGFKTQGISNIFQIVMKNQEWTDKYLTCVGDCAICSFCLLKGKKIGILQH